MLAVSKVSSNEASVYTSGATPPWRRSNAAKSAPLPLKARSRTVSDDELSTTTGSSDADDTSSTLSRSSSVTELAPSVSRDALLMFRARLLRTSKESNPQSGLHCRSLLASPPPGLVKKTPTRMPTGFAPPPGLEMLSGAAATTPAYSPPSFRKEFMTILKDLAVDRNVARAVRRVRAQAVPRERQAAEYADAVTFVLEETRGAARRSFVALLAGLAYGVYERKLCIEGLDIFFDSVYPDLQSEVPKLSKLITVELLPTLGSVFTPEELSLFASSAKA